MADKSQKLKPIILLGAAAIGILKYLGGMSILFQEMIVWIIRCFKPGKLRFRWDSLSIQMVRVGVRSLGIVILVQSFIGVILALQLAPSLDDFGQIEKIASVIGIGGFRMLGPIITAVVLSGFAGASIAAELGTMVVAEEIEALQAMALNPVRFLVIPRVVATFIMMVLLTVVADVVICFGGYIISRLVLGPEAYIMYWENIRTSVDMVDMVTGLIQAGVFGILIGLIASYEGLKVRGGAEGVGHATTMTVVYSLIATILAACVFTVGFYLFGV